MAREVEVGRSRKYFCAVRNWKLFFGLVGRLAIVTRENAKPDLM